MTDKLTYDEAYTELQQIAKEIEDESVSIDVLGEKVKRASELIEFCPDLLCSEHPSSTMRALRGRCLSAPATSSEHGG